MRQQIVRARLFVHGSHGSLAIVLGGVQSLLQEGQLTRQSEKPWRACELPLAIGQPSLRHANGMNRVGRDGHRRDEAEYPVDPGAHIGLLELAQNIVQFSWIRRPVPSLEAFGFRASRTRWLGIVVLA